MVWCRWVWGAVCTGRKLGGLAVGAAVEGVGGVSLANRGEGNTRKSGFYIERGRDGVRMG